MSYKATVMLAGVPFEMTDGDPLELFKKVATMQELAAQVASAKNPESVRLMHRILDGKHDKFSLLDAKAGEVLDFGQPINKQPINLFAYSKTAKGYKGWERWGKRDVEDDAGQTIEAPVETAEMTEIDNMVDEMYSMESGEKMVAFCRHISQGRTSELRGLKPSEVSKLHGSIKQRYEKWLLERTDAQLPF